MKSNILIFLLSMLSLQLMSQTQADAFIKEAQGFLAQKKYKEAQLSLQDAINDINNILAMQIAEALPAEINGLKSSGDATANATGMGMMGGGFSITKNYSNPSKEENTAEVQIMANSPMMSTYNMYLSNPSMLGQGYKSVRVGTYRAILNSEIQEYDDNGVTKKIRHSELQIPLTQTLITIKAEGFATEQEELAFATKLDIDKLKMSLGE